MSSFVALNIEPDDDYEDLDDTKEIQIEEALKRYQNALKLHSQGPEFYDQAHEAYKALFESEIFRYPEAISDYKRDQLWEIGYGDSYTLDEAVEGELAPDSINSASSALPQIIALSYKNHAQFMLDRLKHSLTQVEEEDESQFVSEIKFALEDFADALEKDDTDMDLWRKSSRVGGSLKKYRIARFCLETIIDGNVHGMNERVGNLGLDHVFAVQDLQKILQSLQDVLSLNQIPLKRPRKGLAPFLAKRADLYPFLPDHTDIAHSTDIEDTPPRYSIAEAASGTWKDVGSAILEALTDDSESQSPVSLRIQIPTGDSRLPFHQRSNSQSSEILSNHQDAELPDAENVEVTTVVPKSHPSSPKEQSESKDEQPETEEIAKDATDTGDKMEEDIGNDGNEELKVPLEDTDVQINASHSRKRSSASIANEEPIDGGRTKSRRIKARESIAEAAQQEEIVFDQAKYFEDRLETFAHADQWMFSTAAALLSKFGIEDLGTIDELKHAINRTNESISPHDPSHESNESVSMRDLREVMEHWPGAQNQKDIFTSYEGLEHMKQFGLKFYLERSRQVRPIPREDTEVSDDGSLPLFLKTINSGHFHVQQVAFKWLEYQLTSHPQNGSLGLQPTSGYASKPWPQTMQDLVKDLLIETDAFTFNMISHNASQNSDMLALNGNAKSISESSLTNLKNAEMAQAIYELHLNIYAFMISPNGQGNATTIALQQDRLRRWESLARTLINDYNSKDDNDLHSGLVLRHLWSTIMQFNMTDGAEREYVLACLEHLKRILKYFDEPHIVLVNNTTMPELSVSAVEQEIARVSSMEFFLQVFGPGNEDPVALIESIEPILDPSAVEHVETTASLSETASEVSIRSKKGRDLSFFLDRGDITLKLLLWRRLQKAYEAIQYPTKVISCSLRSIELIIKELHSSSYLELPGDQRRESLLKWLNRADYLMLNVVGKIFDDPKGSFECIDMEHLQSSMSAIARLARLLHSFVLFEDSVRIGQVNPPELRPAVAAKAYDAFKEKLRSMLIRVWVLQYALIKEGIEQNRELFDMPSDDCINYLRSIHNAVGRRSYCKYGNKILLKVMKRELLTLDSEDGYEPDIAQVLYDYYGLKFSSELDISLDHGCPVEKLDRPTALTMAGFAMLQAKRMNVKDFLKSDLKSTMDTIEAAIGAPSKVYSANTQNKRIINAFLKSSINPSSLYQAVKGVCGVSVVPAHTESFTLAESGWYFWLGFATLMKFKSQKRAGPTSAEDLDAAATFFRRELEHGIERWETWYRLAQVYDTRLEEDITWTADKLNNHRADLASLERKAIHAYSMALSLAVRAADPSPETKKMMSDLYTQFGFRIYASSRAPFSMNAFSLTDFARHFNSARDRSMYTSNPFGDMKQYSAWNFAGYLFRKAIIDRPMNWVNHYMFSKCLWKMFTSNDPLKERFEPVEVDDILDSLDASIESLPKKRDSRSDPILEPHFKQVSLLHKLVKRGDLAPRRASEKLLTTPWAKKLSAVDDFDAWKPFLLAVLKNLGAADKSNWHHRIVARAAHVIYDHVGDDQAAAGAKHEFSQHTFTKTMTLQVWRPENERPGRHFVYTTRYVYFFVHLLDQLDDKADLDLLLRRVRRRPNDHVGYLKLWEDICGTYIRIFRRLGQIPIGHEEVVFKPLGLEEFMKNAHHLDSWVQTPNAFPSPVVDLVREAVELKRLNSGLIKPSVFEDLIGDAYALLYQKMVPQILDGIAKEENRARMKVDHLLSVSVPALEEVNAEASASNQPVDNPSEKATAPRARAKGVTRREIQRRADAIASKAAIARMKMKAARPTDDDSKHPTEHQVADEGQKDDVQEEQSKPATDEPPKSTEAPNVPSRTPPSVQDSDESSELSELDESRFSDDSKTRLSMFPNLVVKRATSQNPQSSSDISVDGKDADEDKERDDENEGRESDGDGDPGDVDGDDGDGGIGSDGGDRDGDVEMGDVTAGTDVDDDAGEGEGEGDDEDDGGDEQGTDRGEDNEGDVDEDAGVDDGAGDDGGEGVGGNANEVEEERGDEDGDENEDEDENQEEDDDEDEDRDGDNGDDEVADDEGADDERDDEEQGDEDGNGNDDEDGNIDNGREGSDQDDAANSAPEDPSDAELADTEPENTADSLGLEPSDTEIG